MKGQVKLIGARITKRLDQLILVYLQHDTHLDRSEFFRDAIREKIRRDAPDLFASLFREAPASQGIKIEEVEASQA